MSHHQHAVPRIRQPSHHFLQHGKRGLIKTAVELDCGGLDVQFPRNSKPCLIVAARGRTNHRVGPQIASVQPFPYPWRILYATLSQGALKIVRRIGIPSGFSMAQK